VNAIDAEPTPAVATNEVAADGVPTGTIDALDVDATESPTALVAMTTNVYAVPVVNSDTVHDNGPDDHEHDLDPGVEVTVYDVISEPPSDAGADHDTVTEFAVTASRTGADGAPGFSRGMPVTNGESTARDLMMTGEQLASTVPSPSWPYPFAPQLRPEPVYLIETVASQPAATIVLPVAGLLTGTSESVVVPFPNCPE
jgi:hypothetical protein